ncbi:hypothetical protein ABEX08_29225 [Priestia megaterium]
MNSRNSITEYEKKEENGWYLLVIDEDNKVVPTLNYEKIEGAFLENITSIAINRVKNDAFLYGTGLDKIKSYEVTLLHYSKGKVISRYIMKYKDQVSGVDGCYDIWEYTVPNKKGEFEPYDKNYTYWEAHRFPIIWSFVQILLTGLAYFVPNADNTATVYSAFGLFISGLMYSAFSVWKKDLIKRHYLKDNLLRILVSLFTFEAPVIITAISTVWKISPIAGKFTWNFAISGIILIFVKIICTLLLEIDKKRT